MEARTRHFWVLVVGTQRCSLAGKQMVCHGCWELSDQDLELWVW